VWGSRVASPGSAGDGRGRQGWGKRLPHFEEIPFSYRACFGLRPMLFPILLSLGKRRAGTVSRRAFGLVFGVFGVLTPTIGRLQP